MATHKSDFTVNLFYSYSHKDTRHRESMEKSLALLKREGSLKDWSDQSIQPGHNISAAVRQKMNDADILVFLLSPDFIDSDECIKEWNYAKELASQNPQLIRIPIIVRDCPWLDFMGSDDLKALPNDGWPVAEFTSQDKAWHQVYAGIKGIVNEIRNNFTVNSGVLADMERTDFIAQESIKLSDIFVFLPLLHRNSQSHGPDRPVRRITDPDELLGEKYSLIHGPDSSGKTALAKFMFLKLAKQSSPVLYLDLNAVPDKAGEDFIRETYHSQFHGDYSMWKLQEGKTLILDNLSGRSQLIDFVLIAKELFERVIVTLASDVFYAYYRDEARLADFEVLEIAALSQTQQEQLIRKRLTLTSGIDSVLDGDVDKVEDRVNSIILTNKVVPRYPFFVLCILQTYEAYMPAGLNITSYGHCYFALIVASLVRAGISRQDSDINVCLNFAEHLAYKTFEHLENKDAGSFNFDNFVMQYKSRYFISDSMINRLKHEEFGLIKSDGKFRSEYMRHFFLGRYLSRNGDDNRLVIQRLCEQIYVTENYLTLLFTIHHTTDQKIIDDILVRTMSTLDQVNVAKLDRSETRRFEEMVAGLPKSILSADSIESERCKEREARENLANHSSDVENPEYSEEPQVKEIVNGIYLVLKNIEITGQILRNKYGSMTKSYIEEMIQVVADGGLRLVNVILKDEQEIAVMANYIKAKHPDYEINEIRRDLGWFSFIWTMMNVESVVKAINVPEVRESIDKVTKDAETPAYDIISYCTLLDSASELTPSIRKELERLLDKHDYPFFRGILSLRTQHYMNTHRSKAKIEQAICSLLEIKYRPRLLKPGS